MCSAIVTLLNQEFIDPLSHSFILLLDHSLLLATLFSKAERRDSTLLLRCSEKLNNQSVKSKLCIESVAVQYVNVHINMQQTNSFLQTWPA